MFNNKEILLNQICRFGMLSYSQLKLISEKKYSHQSLSRYLNALWGAGYLKKSLTTSYKRGIYAATSLAYVELYNIKNRATEFPASNKTEHTLKFAEIIFKLSRFENITGMATEFELSRSDVDRFTGRRIPDGTLQITRDVEPFEIAVEFELNQKSHAKINEFLKAYENTFQSNLLCRSVLVVCETQTIKNAYLRQLQNYSEDTTKRVLVLTKNELDDLNMPSFGQATKSIDRLEMIKRYHSKGCTHPRYEIIKKFSISSPHRGYTQSHGDNNMETDNE